MSDTFSKVEVINGVACRRRFSTDLKLAVVAETMQPGMSISYVARRHGLSPRPGVPLEAVDERRRVRGSAPMTRLFLWFFPSHWYSLLVHPV